jgi:hypothetical protein
MASSTKIKHTKKAMKKAKAGIKRKTHDRIHGSTAKDLPLDKPNAHEAKAKAARAGKK